MADPTPFKVLGVSGSLRKDSYNTAALRAVQELAPAGMTVEIFDIGGFPLYNDDVRLGAGYPPVVAEFRAKIAASDAVLFASPEYNYSISGVLKNALDWASRPPDQPFNEKPVGIMGVSSGMLGTSRAQYHLRQCMVFLNAYPVNRPEVMINMAKDKFDAQGRLLDGATRGFVRDMLVSLAAWSRRLRAGDPT